MPRLRRVNRPETLADALLSELLSYTGSRQESDTPIAQNVRCSAESRSETSSTSTADWFKVRRILSAHEIRHIYFPEPMSPEPSIVEQVAVRPGSSRQSARTLVLVCGVLRLVREYMRSRDGLKSCCAFLLPISYAGAAEITFRLRRLRAVAGSPSSHVKPKDSTWNSGMLVLLLIPSNRIRQTSHVAARSLSSIARQTERAGGASLAPGVRSQRSV